MADATPRTRRFCPLCDWHLDTPDPDPSPAVTPDWLATARVEHGDLADDPVFLALLAHVEPIEAEIRSHLETHALIEWVAEVMRLRRELEPLAALAPGVRDESDAAEFFKPGHTYLSANGWFKFTCHVVVAGVALGIEEQVKGFELHRPLIAKRRVWKSVRVAGCDTDVTEPLAAMELFEGAMDRLIRDPGAGEAEVEAARDGVLRLGGLADA